MYSPRLVQYVPASRPGVFSASWLSTAGKSFNSWTEQTVIQKTLYQHQKGSFFYLTQRLFVINLNNASVYQEVHKNVADSNYCSSDTKAYQLHAYSDATDGVITGKVLLTLHSQS